jgi:glucose-1-phosphate adenylyltransferase
MTLHEHRRRHGDYSPENIQPEAIRFVTELTHATVALVLAGGRGTRLRQLTDWRCKPAVPFGGKFRIIDFTLSNCVNSGIRRIGVATQYKANSLIRHIQRGWSFLDGRFEEFIELLPAQQQVTEAWYSGTADAVFQNLSVLRRHSAKYVLVLAGDHIYKMDYGRMLAFHVARQADLTVGCAEVPLADAGAFGVMSIDETGRVMSFEEKPAKPQPIPGQTERALASMGIYVFNAGFLNEQLMRDAGDPRSSHDFGKDVIPHVMSRDRVFAHSLADSCVGMTPGAAPYWRDVGTIDAYWEANMELTRVVPELNLYDSTWPIWTYQEQMPPAKFVFDDDDRRGLALDSMVSGGCVISGATVRRSLLFTDVRIESRSVVEDSVVLPNVRVGNNVVLKRVVIDRGCEIKDGMQVGVDAAEDRRRFHVTEAGVTLVTPEMLGQSVYGVP